MVAFLVVVPDLTGNDHEQDEILDAVLFFDERPVECKRLASSDIYACDHALHDRCHVDLPASPPSALRPRYFEEKFAQKMA